MTDNVKKDDGKPLKNGRHELFCAKYCECMNGTEAYMYAYGAKNEVARTNAARLLSSARIQERIEQLRRFTTGKFNITRERIAKELGRIAFTDRGALFNEDGELKKLSEMSEDERSIIAGIEVDELMAGQFNIGKTKKVKTESKTKAMELLTKMFGLNEPDKLKAEVDNNFPQGILQVELVAPVIKKEEL